MNLLSLILAHVIIVILFELSLGSILWVMFLLFIDYCLIHIKMRVIRKGELHSLFKHWYKKVGFIFNLLAVSAACFLIYSEYFSITSRQVNEQFLSCTMYEEISYMENYVPLIPASVKVPIIEASAISDMLIEYIELKESCETEEELQSMSIQLQEDVKKKQLIVEELMTSVENRCYIVYVWAILLFLYKLLWNWDSLVFLINRWKTILSRRVVR